MKLFKRCCWLAAWIAWARCGVALHREIPRDVGGQVTRIPLAQGEHAIGILDESPCVVTWLIKDAGPSLVRVWDVESGKLLRELQGPLPLREATHTHTRFSIQHGLLVFEESGSARQAQRFVVLNLQTGGRRFLPPECEGRPILHTKLPWALFPGPTETAAVVVDLRSGRIVFQWTPPADVHPAAICGPAFFLGDLVAVPVLDFGGGRSLQCWRIPQESEPAIVRLGVDVDWPPSVSATGRIAWRKDSGHGAFKVFDVHAARVVFNAPGGSTESLSIGRRPGPVISPDGMTCFDRESGTIWDLDRGVTVWRKTGGPAWPLGIRWGTMSGANSEVPFVGRIAEQIVSGGPDSSGGFETEEVWALGWSDWRKLYPTFAIRDGWSGRLLHRTWVGWRRYDFETRGIGIVDSRGQWLVTSTGAIHRLPPPANWPLLAICQFILALPLVLLWAVLRWRRRRAAPQS